LFVIVARRARTFRVDARAGQVEVSLRVLGATVSTSQRSYDGIGLCPLRLIKKLGGDWHGSAIVIACGGSAYCIAADREAENLRLWYAESFGQSLGPLDEMDRPVLWGMW
ncbi:MAG TPA: hypothetical protein VHC70_04245, partial [Phycisphaerales bacterium]|nr:hypothetical protein [Phycisphaerales bacterium]